MEKHDTERLMLQAKLSLTAYTIWEMVTGILKLATKYELVFCQEISWGTKGLVLTVEQ